LLAGSAAGGDGDGTNAVQALERVAFAADSAELTPAALAQVDAAATVIKNQPKASPTVALEGHGADNEHGAMKLSLARASTVRLALIARGVDADRLLVRASGAAAPVCTQQSESCHARNRTVEFVVLAAAAPPAVAAKAEAEKAAAAPEPAKTPAKPAAPVPLVRVEFAKASAVMRPSALADLDILAGFLKATPVSVEILGYADRDERRAAALAGARAEAVRKYLSACGVTDQQLTARAESGERCRSRDEACHARNRRTELRFTESAGPARANVDGSPAPARWP
jgi:outer membrane protein OmpA-like peptidoglycan-associated protein